MENINIDKLANAWIQHHSENQIANQHDDLFWAYEQMDNLIRK